MADHGLSKSRIVACKQCPQRLWLQVHRFDWREIYSEAERCLQASHEVGEVARGLYANGILGDGHYQGLFRHVRLNEAVSPLLAQVPEEYPNKTRQFIQRVNQTGESELTPEAAQRLDEPPYPRYFLNFEAIELAVPRWRLTRPCSTQVPFQWSCHTEHQPGQLQYNMFLDVSGADPRRACAETLIAALGHEGPVLVYSEGFEKDQITELAALFLDLAPALIAINERIIDLLPMVKANYYHPHMQGSWSIKTVMSTVAPELDYAQLIIENGSDVQVAYQEIVHAATPEARKQALTEGLRDYGTLATLAMVRLTWFLEGYGVWTFLPNLIPGSQSPLIPTMTGQHHNPDPLFHSAEEVLRQYCIKANTRMILQPKSYLQRRLRLGFSRATHMMNQLEKFGILSLQAFELST